MDQLSVFCSVPESSTHDVLRENQQWSMVNWVTEYLRQEWIEETIREGSANSFMNAGDWFT